MSDYTQPRYIGLDDVLEAFEKKAKTPYWSLWDKNQCIEQCNIDDETESINALVYEINQSIKHNNSRPLSLLLHPEKESFYDKRKSKAYANIYFVAVQPNYNSHVGGMGNNNSLLPIQQQLNAMQSQLNALQNVNEDEDEDEDESETMGMLNGINTFLEHPLISGIVSKLLSPSQPVQTLSGIEPTQDEIANCINTLFSKGVTIEHLKKLAQMDESKIQMLLAML